jgi:hypothetical protein
MKRFLAISLLVIFIAGQVNLTWADHFCMSFKVQSSVMLGHGELDCGMGEMSSCDDEQEDASIPVFKAPSCCSNDYYSSDSDDNFVKEKSHSDDQITFVAIYTTTLLQFFNEQTDQSTFIASSPPLIQSDRQVLFQTFLL